MAAPKMVLRPRTALGDIGNRVAETKMRTAAKKVVVEGGCGWEPATRPVLATSLEKMATRRALRAAAKEEVLPPVPEPKPEPQPDPSQVSPAACLGPCALSPARGWAEWGVQPHSVP